MKQNIFLSKIDDSVDLTKVGSGQPVEFSSSISLYWTDFRGIFFSSTNRSFKVLVTFWLGVLGLTTSRADWRLVNHFSSVLGQEKSFYIYLPELRQTGEIFPSLYLLHGVGGNYTNWIEASHVRWQAVNHKMILVLPDGGEYGWFFDSPVDSSSRYESYVVRDLIPYIERTFPVQSGRDFRAVCGLSMGGHGAISLALKHPELFGSASSLSGILDLTSHTAMGTAWQLDAKLGPYFQFPERWQRFSCYDLVLQPGLKPKLFFDCGVDDGFALADNRRFKQRLDSLNIAHHYVENPGGHQWVYWDAHLEEHLRFHEASMILDRVTPDFDTIDDQFVYCHPNPFNTVTNISFTSKRDADVRIEVYDRTGRHVKTLVNEHYSAGNWQVKWNGSSERGPVTTGVYFVQCQIADQSSVVKVLVAR